MEAREYLSFAADACIRRLFKQYLVLLEDLANDHEANYRKLFESLPEEYKNQIIQSDYFDEEKQEYYRKRVLDYGNESLRDFHKQFDKFEVDFKTRR